MTASNVIVDPQTQKTLEILAHQTGKSILIILGEAVKEYRRKVFFEGVDRDFAATRSDPELWKEELDERQLSQNTLMDGIEAD